MTTVAFALLASSQVDAATKHTLDGRRSRTARYTGSLDGPAVPTNAATAQQPFQPHLADCTEFSCDVRELKLTLPKNVSSGRFHASVVIPDPELQASLVLYNAEGEVLQQHDSFSGQRGDDFDYRLDVHVEWLPAGQYTLALVDRAGFGGFAANVAWVAHPVDRARR